LGLIAGFIGSKIVNAEGQGFWLNIALGIIGALVGGYLFVFFGATGVTGLNIWSIIVAIVGSVVVLWVYNALMARRRRPRARPEKVGCIFGPRRGLRLPAWPRLGHNFANDLAVSIDERHSPLRFIAAERLRGRVKRRAKGGLGRVGFLLSTFHVVHHSMIPLRPPYRG